MMPIVFCASLVPCPRLYAAAEKSCALRKNPSTRLGELRRKTHDTMIMLIAPRMNPSVGERTMKISTGIQPDGISAWIPALATAAPANPAISAWEDDVGSA